MLWENSKTYWYCPVSLRIYLVWEKKRTYLYKHSLWISVAYVIWKDFDDEDRQLSRAEGCYNSLIKEKKTNKQSNKNPGSYLGYKFDIKYIIKISQELMKNAYYQMSEILNLLVWSSAQLSAFHQTCLEVVMQNILTMNLGEKLL